MKLSRKIIAAIGLVTIALGTAAAAGHAVIRFADYGGITDWRAAADGSLLVQGHNHSWYRATFDGPCRPLKFENQIGFVTDAIGDLDKFSSVVVAGQQCWFDTFEQIDDPDAFSKPDD